MKKQKLLAKVLAGSKNVSFGMAKPYQIRQFPKIVERYNLKIGDGS